MNQQSLLELEHDIQKGFAQQLVRIELQHTEWLTKRSLYGPTLPKRPFEKVSLYRSGPKSSHLPSTQHYIEHLLKYGSLEPEVLVAAAILIERFTAASKYEVSFLKLIATVVFVTQKIILETELWDNIGFSALAGLKPNQLNALEAEYLHEIDFRVFISEEEFKHTRQGLAKKINAGNRD